MKVGEHGLGKDWPIVVGKQDLQDKGSSNKICPVTKAKYKEVESFEQFDRGVL
jgi:hypothetical protein